MDKKKIQEYVLSNINRSWLLFINCTKKMSYTNVTTLIKIKRMIYYGRDLKKYYFCNWVK